MRMIITVFGYVAIVAMFLAIGIVAMVVVDDV